MFWDAPTMTRGQHACDSFVAAVVFWDAPCIDLGLAFAWLVPAGRRSS